MAEKADGREWMGAEEAAQRLGIKPASLYSYVSRGVLSPRRGSDGRASLFDAADVADLALRGRPRRAPGGAELVIGTALTELSDDRRRLRGQGARAPAPPPRLAAAAGPPREASLRAAAAPGP